MRYLYKIIDNFHMYPFFLFVFMFCIDCYNVFVRFIKEGFIWTVDGGGRRADGCWEGVWGLCCGCYIFWVVFWLFWFTLITRRSLDTASLFLFKNIQNQWFLTYDFHFSVKFNPSIWPSVYFSNAETWQLILFFIKYNNLLYNFENRIDWDCSDCCDDGFIPEDDDKDDVGFGVGF